MNSEIAKMVLDTLRKSDAERYISCLYLPPELRRAASAIYAFDGEISRVADLVSEPMPGEIRLQWWRDLIGSVSATQAGPVGELLLETITRHELPREVFVAALDARVFDLYHDPMPDMGSFEGYLGETVSMMFQMVAICAGVQPGVLLADACGHAGMASGIMRLVSRLPNHRRTERMYFPGELLKNHDLSHENWLAEPPDARHGGVLEEILSLAESHLVKARKAIVELPQEVQKVFLPLAFQDSLIIRGRKNGSALLSRPLTHHPLKLQFLALRSAITGRI